ncbi:hypothetical protein F5Y12DRAFT_61543 [Xylaria sp. FL1777]|nr:hypothetical protein F5Y12DRAFT_61543 [Xylaria sp. FL1777]
MSQFFDSSDLYNHDPFHPPERRASSEWSASSNYGTPMTRDSSRESAITTYSDDIVQSPNSEYECSFWSSMPVGDHDSLRSPVSDSSHDIAFPSTSYQPAYMANEENWFLYYDFVADLEPGQQPYWRLKPGIEPTHQLPATRAAEESPRSRTSEGLFICLHKGCTRSFRRKADLERHYLQIHQPAEKKAKYPCDWKRCQRAKEPFYRRDHQRDHYRDYHNEDLMRRGSSSRENQKWWNERKVKLNWWRCTRCLGRVKVKEYGYLCPVCRSSCEQERQYFRTH